jgi:hypothetical protein
MNHVALSHVRLSESAIIVGASYIGRVATDFVPKT